MQLPLICLNCSAYLVVIGDVSFADVKAKVEKVFGTWVKASAPNLTYNDPKNVQYTQINFVDMPNAVQSNISFVNTVSLKMTDKDYFPAILANQIFVDSTIIHLTTDINQVILALFWEIS